MRKTINEEALLAQLEQQERPEEDEENRFRRSSGSHAETAGTDDERKTEQKVVRLPFKIFFCRKPDNDICPAFLSLHQRKSYRL